MWMRFEHYWSVGESSMCIIRRADSELCNGSSYKLGRTVGGILSRAVGGISARCPWGSPLSLSPRALVRSTPSLQSLLLWFFSFSFVFFLLLAPFLLRQELFWSSFQEEKVFFDFLSVICSMIGYFLAWVWLQIGLLQPHRWRSQRGVSSVSLPDVFFQGALFSSRWRFVSLAFLLRANVELEGSAGTPGPGRGEWGKGRAIGGGQIWTQGSFRGQREELIFLEYAEALWCMPRF